MRGCLYICPPILYEEVEIVRGYGKRVMNLDFAKHANMIHHIRMDKDTILLKKI